MYPRSRPNSKPCTYEANAVTQDLDVLVLAQSCIVGTERSVDGERYSDVLGPGEWWYSFFCNSCCTVGEKLH